MPSLTTGDGVRLDYTEHGESSGRAVVLLAGFTAAGTSWLYQQRSLARAGYRVLTVDARGHGTSEDSAHGNRMSRRGADLHEFVTALDLRGATLVGQSMGGNSIWAYLSLFPADRLAGVVIVDQTPKMLNTADWPHGFYGYEPSNAGTLFAEGVPGTGRGTPIATRGIRLARLLRAALPGGWRRGPLSAGQLALLQDHALQDWRDVIARVPVPTLFVAGRESEVWPCEHAAASAALSSLAASVIIERAGHATNIEQPGVFDRHLLRFLAAAASS
ncbi:alpha/beta hydrolase [Microbacteriaceae bacterium VKM Ac-2854]|nr:alpha/beta hydrolase [Microbacteriaceae bacterium VKM Ac-2854]